MGTMAPKSGTDGTGKNWLITSASNKVSLAEALQDAVSIYGSRLYSTDVSVLSAALYSTADFFVSLPADNIKYIDHLIENAMRLGVGFILPTRDEDLLILSKNREVLLANGITVLCSSAKTIELCLDKVAFHSFCCAHGLPVFQNIIDPALARFPVFLRGKDQYGNKVAERVDTLDEYAAKYGRTIPKGFLVTT